MKNISGAVVVFFLCLFAFTKLAGPIPLSLSSVVTQKTDTFSVSGEGNVQLSPDIAIVNAGVTAQSPTVQAAQNELNRSIRAISSAIQKLGISAKDIKTSNYTISPQYDYESSTRRITGYSADSTLTITVRQLDSVNSVIDTATENGANQIGNISFDVDDKDAAENKARELAVQDAKTKARIAAKAAGFMLGRIIHYEEGGGASPRPVLLDRSPMADEAGGIPTQIEPGTNELTVTVTLSYEIR